MEIRRAGINDLDGITALWKSCFGDEGGYLAFYLSRAYRPEWVWLVMDGRLPVSMMTLMPCVEWVDGREKQGTYVYAVATLPDYRHRGLMTLLHDRAEQACRRNGSSFMTLVPAEPSLFAMYRKLGYETCAWLYYGKIEKKGSRERPTQFAPAARPEFTRLRETFLQQFPVSAALSVNDFCYTFEELSVAGYETAMAVNDLGAGYLVYRLEEGQTLLIRESNLPRLALETAALSLAGKTNAESIVIKTAEPWFRPAEKRPFAMMKRLDTEHADKPYYMNLMLDD